jgi:hypothetical protein
MGKMEHVDLSGPGMPPRIYRRENWKEQSNTRTWRVWFLEFTSAAGTFAEQKSFPPKDRAALESILKNT